MLFSKSKFHFQLELYTQNNKYNPTQNFIQQYVCEICLNLTTSELYIHLISWQLIFKKINKFKNEN